MQELEKQLKILDQETSQLFEMMGIQSSATKQRLLDLLENQKRIVEILKLLIDKN